MSNRKEIKYKVNDNGCWICTSHRADTKGFARQTNNKIRNSIHRIFYEKYKGKILDDKYVVHRCKNKTCINPDHLFLATMQQHKDFLIKVNRTAHGERNAGNKLKKEEVIEIFLDSACTQRELGKIYNVAQSTIWKIKTRKKWKRITKEL